MRCGVVCGWRRGRAPQEGEMKNWERFKDWNEAWQYYEAHCVPALTRMEWGRGSWLYMEHIEGESRVDFLRRCGKAYRGSSILTQVGSKELKRLEKLTARQSISKEESKQ